VVKTFCAREGEPPRLRGRMSRMPAAVTSSHVTNGAPQPRMDEEPVDRINRRHHYGQEYRIKPSARWRERRDPDLLLIDVHANGLYPCLKDFLDNVGHDGDRQLPSPSSQEPAWPADLRIFDPQDHPSFILSGPEQEPHENAVVGRKIGGRPLANLFSELVL